MAAGSRGGAHLVLVSAFALSCSGGGNGAANLDAGTAADAALGGGGGAAGAKGGGATGLAPHALCGAPFPSQPCDGDPHGRWELAALCVNRFENCPGARVTVTGEAKASLEFRDDGSRPSFFYQYDYDTESRLSVPASCLNGASCESIGCFAGENPCSCVYGSSRGGSADGEWTPRISGEVLTSYGSKTNKTTVRFCAGAKTADAMIGGTRVVWNRVCTDGMDCRPADPCHIGRAQCAASGLTCQDTGNPRPVGTTCGEDRVCDAQGACVPCAAGTTCTLAEQPCKAAVVSCRSAKPVCTATENLPEGSSCGDKRTCVSGVCLIDDGQPCQRDSECRDSCTCGDAKCTTHFCGKSCPCRFASPGGECGAVVEDGTQPVSSCDKACFAGRCLTEVGQRCTKPSECGSGHCTCWLPNCSGGRLCSTVACPCQYAASGAQSCSGPLSDGLEDYGCMGTQMCIQGMCQ